jgi:hypothetical protein
MGFGFDIFLRRLFFSGRNPGLYLKGGYSLELRFAITRSTRDLDFATKEALGKQIQGQPKQGEHLRQLIQDAVAEPIEELGFDRFFTITVGNVSHIQGGGGGYRINIVVALPKQEVAKFHLDITVGVPDHPCKLEQIQISKYTLIEEPSAFPMIECINVNHFFADKLHAYTKPRDTPNTRTKDLIDLTLLVQSNLLSPTEVIQEIKDTFAFEGTHQIPISLPSPPVLWERKFDELALECQLKKSMQEAFELVNTFWNSLPKHPIDPHPGFV